MTSNEFLRTGRVMADLDKHPDPDVDETRFPGPDTEPPTASRFEIQPLTRDGVELTAVGMKFSEQTSVEVWEETGVLLGRLEQAKRFWLGDLVIAGEGLFSKTHRDVAKLTGLSPQSVADSKWLASRIPVSRRRENLTWSHHREVAALDEAKQDELLDRAVRESLTVKNLRALVAQNGQSHEGESATSMDVISDDFDVALGRTIQVVEQCVVSAGNNIEHLRSLHEHLTIRAERLSDYIGKLTATITQNSVDGATSGPTPVQIESLPGFVYVQDFLGEDEHDNLLGFIDGIDNWEHPAFRGHKARRLRVSFGHEYQPNSRSLLPAARMPDLLLQLRERCAARLDLDPSQFNQGIILQFPKGAQIGAHVDGDCFGEYIMGVNLASTAKLRFEREGHDSITNILVPGSFYSMAGEARWSWTHRIMPVKELRYSITFRMVHTEHKKVEAAE